MKRLLLILISIFLTINIVSAGIIQYHHHHHGDPSICLCITLDHVDDYHTGDGDCCANDCKESESGDCQHALHLDDFNVEKLAPNVMQVVDFQILGILINNILHDIITEPVSDNTWSKDRAVAVTDLCSSDAAKRRGPPQC